MLSVITDHWKYNWYLADDDELYSVPDDPDETTAERMPEYAAS